MTRISIPTAVFILFCLPLGCDQGGPSQTQLQSPNAAQTGKLSRPLDDTDDYAVYDALLGANSSSDIIVLKEGTTAGIICSDLSSGVDPRLRDALKNFAEQNSRQRLFKVDRFTLGRKVELLSSAGLDAIFSGGAIQGWAQFRKSYPKAHGYIELSAVGFSPDKNFAVVYSAVHCGAKCGAGGMVTLSKKDGVWRQNRDRLCSWIS